MKKLILTIVVLCLLILDTQAQQVTHNLSFSTTDVNSSQNNGYDVIFMNDMYFIKDADLAGQPQLPIKTINLLLPQGTAATDVNITSTATVLSGTYNLYPVQPPVDPNDSNPPDFVPPNPAIYTNNNPFPSNSLLSFHTVQYREYTYVSIRFCPFSYKPLDQEVSLLNQININVSCSTDTSIKEYKLRPYTQIDQRAYQSIQNRIINTGVIDNFYPNTKVKLTTYSNKTQGTQQGQAFEPTDLPALAGSAVQYVIITNDSDVYGNPIVNANNETFLTNKFQEFANWKTANGTPAKVVTLDDIKSNYQGGDIPEQIREFIKDAVKLWNTEYILIGGTASIIPVRFTPSSNDPIMATDLYYAAINGNNWNANANAVFGETLNDLCDFEPDIAVGRAPIDTVTEMELFLEKNYTYARSIKTNDIQDAFIPNGSFLNQQLNIGGIVKSENWPETPWNTGLALPTFWYIETEFSDDSDQYTMLEYLSNWVVKHSDWAPAYDPEVNGDIMDEKIYSGGADHDRVLEKMNEKPGFIFHTDHSGPHNKGLTEYIKSTHGINDQDMYNNLETTTHQYPILMSGGCNTAPIDMKYYIGSDWLNAKGGGVAYLGTSKDVTNSISFSFSQRFFDVLYNDANTIFLGDIINRASHLASNQTGIGSFWQQRLYQLLGDPELLVYTDNPDSNPLTVTVTPSTNTLLTTGNQNISVKVDWVGDIEETATICLYKENEVLAVQKGAVKGTIYTFNTTPDTIGDIHITVTRHNANPYETTIQVASNNPTVHLYKSDIKIYDLPEGGEEIDVIQPGQTVYLSIELTNTGDNTASSIVGELFADTTSLGSSSYTSINVNASAFSNTRYAYTIPNDLQYGSYIDLSLEIQEANESFTEPFIINTKSPKLDIGNRVVSVNGVTNTTGEYTNGDNISLKVDIHNYSDIITNITQAVLSLNPLSDIQNVTFNNPNQPYGVIGSFDVEDETFNLTINEDCTTQSFMLFLTLTDSYSNTYQFDINLSESYPEEIENFDFLSTDKVITLKWSNAHWNPTTEEWEIYENIKGNNVYRYDESTGEYVRQNDYLLTSPVFFDKDCTVNTSYKYKISIVSETGYERSIENLSSQTAWTSLHLHVPFPKTASISIANFSKAAVPTVCDINGNHEKEIFSIFKQNLTSQLMAYKQDGTELYDIDPNTS